MRKLFFATLITLTIFAFSVFAQEKQSANAPELIEEFSWYNSEDLEKRLDGVARIFYSKLQVLIYGGEKDLPDSRYRFAATVKAYLEINKGLTPDKMLIEQCGLEKKFKVKFYNLPFGVEKKTCSEQFLPINKTILFDNLFESSESGCCAVDGYDEQKILGSLEGFIKYLKQYPESNAYIIINSRRKISIYDKKKDAQRNLSKAEINNLVNNKLARTKEILAINDIDSSRFEIFTGKMQKDEYGEFTWKLWIMPPGGEIPKEVAVYLKRQKATKKK